MSKKITLSWFTLGIILWIGLSIPIGYLFIDSMIAYYNYTTATGSQWIGLRGEEHYGFTSNDLAHILNQILPSSFFFFAIQVWAFLSLNSKYDWIELEIT